MATVIEVLTFMSAVVFFFFHIGDIATDVIACVAYHNAGADNFFKATLAFILIPFVYIVYLGAHEVGRLDNVSMIGQHGYNLAAYFTGPLFPYIFKGKLSETAMSKIEGIAIFGSGYMEDIPQVIIACFFVFSNLNKGASKQDKLISLVQLAFSALSGIYKLINGARKIGGGKVNCCGRNFKC